MSLQRTATNGVSGWFSYSFGKIEYTDRRTGEQFAGDVDERHNVSANATWRLSTGRVSDLTEELFPIIPSAGLLIEF